MFNIWSAKRQGKVLVLVFFCTGDEVSWFARLRIWIPLHYLGFWGKLIPKIKMTPQASNLRRNGSEKLVGVVSWNRKKLWTQILYNNLSDSYWSASYETANKRMERNVATIVWKRRFTPRECDFADMVVHNCRIAVEGNGTNALQLGALLFALLSSQVSALWCHPTSAALCNWVQV